MRMVWPLQAAARPMGLELYRPGPDRLRACVKALPRRTPVAPMQPRMASADPRIHGAAACHVTEMMISIDDGQHLLA